MATIKDVPVFAIGTHNGRTFDGADLDCIVRAFRDGGLSGKLPVKLGHSNDDSLPAQGWITGMRRAGNEIHADIADVPPDLIKEIKQGRWRHVSIELLGDVTLNGRQYKWAPDGLAILGAARPAVQSLEGLHKLVARALPGLAYRERLAFSFNGGFAMDNIEELKAKLAAAERREHVANLRRLVEAAVNNHEAAPAALNMFSRQFGDDSSDSIMRATPSDVKVWLGACAPRDKVAGQRSGMTTRVERRVDDDGGDTGGETAGQQVVRFAAAVAAERGYPANWQQNQQQHLDVMATVQQRHPQVYATYVSEPWSLCG